MPKAVLALSIVSKGSSVLKLLGEALELVGIEGIYRANLFEGPESPKVEGVKSVAKSLIC